MVPVVFCNGRIFKVPKHETEYLDEIAVTANNGIDKLYKKQKKVRNPNLYQLGFRTIFSAGSHFVYNKVMLGHKFRQKNLS